MKGSYKLSFIELSFPKVDFFQEVLMRTTFILVYLLIMNIVGYAMMGIDKKRAIQGAWRISEASLFLVALLGGSLCSILGMQRFRHKTKHWYFKYGMPAILILQIALPVYISISLASVK